MASTRDYDVEKKRWRWTYHLFRGVVAVCVLYVAGTQIIERASRNAALPPPPPPMVEPPPRRLVAEAPPPPAPPPPEPQVQAQPPAQPQPQAVPPPPAPPPASQVVEAPSRPTFHVLGGVNGRAGPGVEFPVVRLITSDLVLVATGETLNNWIEVFVRGGLEDQKFWVWRNLLLPEPQ